jgi:hypothetical protein
MIGPRPYTSISAFARFASRSGSQFLLVATALRAIEKR